MSGHIDSVGRDGYRCHCVATTIELVNRLVEMWAKSSIQCRQFPEVDANCRVVNLWHTGLWTKETICTDQGDNRSETSAVVTLLHDEIQCGTDICIHVALTRVRRCA